MQRLLGEAEREALGLAEGDVRWEAQGVGIDDRVEQRRPRVGEQPGNAVSDVAWLLESDAGDADRLGELGEVGVLTRDRPGDYLGRTRRRGGVARCTGPRASMASGDRRRATS